MVERHRSIKILLHGLCAGHGELYGAQPVAEDMFVLSLVGRGGLIDEHRAGGHERGKGKVASGRQAECHSRPPSRWTAASLLGVAGGDGHVGRSAAPSRASAA